MTNKLPEVGKRYKFINSNYHANVWQCISINDEIVLEQENGDLIQYFPLKENFWRVFEEVQSKEEISNNQLTIENLGLEDICFYANKQEVLRLSANGDIFVKGKLIENDKEVFDALRIITLNNY